MRLHVDERLVQATRRLGDVISPERAHESVALYAALHASEPYIGVEITRDLQYGEHDRHRLDLFRPKSAPALPPIVVFVHGGNFVAGDKHTPGSPFHDNVGVWAARAGFTGVTMTYRLAPESPWPAGAQDVGACVRWLRGHLVEHGGDPDTIVLVGASAGATHVASYLAGHGRDDPEPSVAGAALLSGMYDLVAFGNPAVLTPYYGPDAASWSKASPLQGVVRSSVPVMVVVAGYDPPAQHHQAVLLVDALARRDGHLPHIAFLPLHNHFSEVLHLGTDDTVFGEQLSLFAHTCRLSKPAISQIPTGG